MTSKGIATSRTTPYNPQGNGQVERYNGIVWKGITLALRDHGLSTEHWQETLPDVMHSIRSLLSTATNSTPHERFSGFSRRSTSGVSLPTWLSTPGPILLKKHVRANKYDPLVNEVELLETTPNYAHIRHPDGRESIVSLKHLAPTVDQEPDLPSVHSPQRENKSTKETSNSTTGETTEMRVLEEPNEIEPRSIASRRSSRKRTVPDRLSYEN